MRDKGSHFFDLTCWIAGERPVETHVAGACLTEPRFADSGDVDTAMIILRMEGGVVPPRFGVRPARHYTLTAFHYRRLRNDTHERVFCRDIISR